MSLYREARSRRRRLWISASAALLGLAALAIGVVFATSGDPSPEERLASLQKDVQPALAALELIPIHYASPNPTTHAAAADQLEVARETIAAKEDELRALDPARTTRLLDDLASLGLLVQTTGRDGDVERVSNGMAAELRAIVRLD